MDDVEQALVAFVSKAQGGVINPQSSGFAADVLEQLSHGLGQSRSFEQHIVALERIARRGETMTEKEAAVVQRALRLSPKHETMKRALTGTNTFRLAMLGAAPICARVADGEDLHDLAAELGVPYITLFQFLKSSPENRALFKAAREASAFVLAAEADVAADRGEASRAGHYRWRAERSGPAYFAKPKDSELPSESGSGGGFSLHIDLSGQGQADGAAARGTVLEATVQSADDPVALMDNVNKLLGGSQDEL